MTWGWLRWLWLPVEFVFGLALLCLLATFAVVSAIILSFGFIGSVLLVEASEMWDTLRSSIRTSR